MKISEIIQALGKYPKDLDVYGFINLIENGEAVSLICESESDYLRNNSIGEIYVCSGCKEPINTCECSWGDFET